MKKFCCAALASAVLAMPAFLQGTTGVPSINDYTVGGMTSGSTSCTPITIPAGITAFTVSGSAPGLVYALYAAIPLSGVPCCSPCFFIAGPSPCLIPNSGCGVATNQTIDIIPGGPCQLLAPVIGTLGAGGIGTSNINVPAGFQFATQAVILDPTCKSSTLPVVLTQAYEVRS